MTAIMVGPCRLRTATRSQRAFSACARSRASTCHTISSLFQHRQHNSFSSSSNKWQIPKLHPFGPNSTSLSQAATYDSSSSSINTSIATTLLSSLKSNAQISPLSHTFPSVFTPHSSSSSVPTESHSTAAAAAAADINTIRSTIRSLRLTQHGERPVGRKIGFTNRGIWARYNVAAPIWGYVYDSTTTTFLQSGDNVSLDSLSCLEPRIEPEIVLGLRHGPKTNEFLSVDSEMSDSNLLAHAVAWYAPAFEVVISPFPGWKFGGGAAEADAAFALHGMLVLGPAVPVSVVATDSQKLERQLSDFTVELRRDGKLVDRGTGANVLGGGPVEALRHLLHVLEKESPPESKGNNRSTAVDDLDVRLRGGEVVSTGTLTDAWLIGTTSHKEVWEMKVAGLDGVTGLQCRFVV